MTPVELVGLARCKTQRNVGLGHGAAAIRRPALSMPPPRTVAAVITEAAKLLENTDQRQPLPLRLGRIRRQQPVQRLTPGSHAGIGLVLALVAELRLLRTQDLAHHLARDLQLALLDFPWTSDSRRIFAIVSKTNIQNTNASDQAGGILMTPSLRGPVWTKSTP